MRFLKIMILLLFIGLATRAQDAPAMKDTIAVFQADKTAGTLELNEQSNTESTVQQLRKDAAFWYADMDFRTEVKKEPQRHSFFKWLFRQQWFYNLLWTVIFGSFIAVIIVFLVKSDVRLFHKKAKPLSKPDLANPQETIFTINYDEALRKAVTGGDFALAVRLHFLQLLVLLSRNKSIQYKEAYTNSDYLIQMRSTNKYASFKKLIRHFDFAWYGKYSISPATYQTIETDFILFKKSMGI